MPDNDLRERVDLLTRTMNEIVDNLTHMIGKSKANDAYDLALYSIVLELVENAGIPRAQFVAHFRLRKAYFHDRLLQSVESSDPAFAAEIDTREIADVSTSEGYPPLFPPPSHP
jgi:hypothetical protein